jgi:hypothetical protein
MLKLQQKRKMRVVKKTKKQSRCVRFLSSVVEFSDFLFIAIATKGVVDVTLDHSLALLVGIELSSESERARAARKRRVEGCGGAC